MNELTTLAENNQILIKNHWDLFTEDQQEKINLFGTSFQWAMERKDENRALREMRGAASYLQQILFNA